jgi:anion-transporting  ArsA/GET3 family ATPase
VDEKGSLPQLFGRGDLSYQPAEISPGIWGLNITAEEALKEYLQLQYRMRRLSNVFTHTHFVDYLATSAPGIQDLLVIRKIWYLEQGPKKGGTPHEFDTIIVDAPAAGHMLTFVGAPRGIHDAVSVGPIRTQVQWVLDMIEDPKRTRVSLVTTAEEMPVTETLETQQALTERLGISLGPVFANGLYEGFFSKQERAAVADVDPPTMISLAAEVGLELDAGDIAAGVSYARFLEARRSIQQKHMRTLKRGVDTPLVELPFLFSAGLGAPDIVTLADVIESRLEGL